MSLTVKKNLKQLFFLLIIILLASCKTVSNADFMGHSLNGLYVSKLPCQGCEGMLTFYEFSPDYNFKKYTNALGLGEKVTHKQGVYELDSRHKVITLKDVGGLSIEKLQWVDGQQLLAIDIRGEPLKLIPPFYKVEKKIFNKKWVATELQGKPVVLSDNYFIKVEPFSNQFIAMAGCNNIGGEVSFTTSGIKFDKIHNTRKHCKNMLGELAMLSLLKTANKYAVDLDHQTLFISNSQNVLLGRFELVDEDKAFENNSKAGTTIIWVNAQKIRCQGADSYCFEIQESGQLNSENWTKYSGEIHNFTFEPGYIYKLKVEKITRNKTANDQAGFYYKTLQIEQKQALSKILTANEINGKWLLTQIQGVRPNSQHTPEVIFDTDTRSVRGFDGCNYFSGQMYNKQQGKVELNLQSEGAEKCPNDNVSLLFVPYLKRITKLEIQGQELVATDANGRETLRFKYHR